MYDLSTVLEIKWIPSYEGIYAITNTGQVFTFHKGSPNILKATVNKSNGYPYVMLQNNGSKENVTVHSLVAKLFVYNPNPDKYKVINHKDENKENSYYLNLEWCDTLYNNQYSLKDGYIVTSPDGVEHEVTSLRAFALERNLDPSGMTKVAKGKQKTHKGYKVRYK
ncbi:hypothetical protein AG74_124 [Vibrio phage AG74]|uniref:NUMOD4 domain-containing protein n=1 Tax=Vibrio phage AG74 TaxID=2736261 RepID=A0A6M9Z2I9_9CAUD|nr:hypothetical protein KNV06_gp179 [Vibrio phage AG74]QKN84964.1 hypothetical protein AG74_124 [Vibrio phage AG74]